VLFWVLFSVTGAGLALGETAEDLAMISISIVKGTAYHGFTQG
jgi:hypothetical protein